MSILISVEAEDKLQCVIGARLLDEFGEKYEIDHDPQKHSNARSLLDSKGHPDSKGGIEREAQAWNRAAADGNIRLVLMDMDDLASPHNKRNCPESQIRRILGNEKKHDNFLFRIAVFEAESWLLADRDGVASFFDVKATKIPDDVDGLKNTKEFLRSLTGGKKISRKIHRKIYEFAKSCWKPKRAAKNSKSLRRTLERLDKFGG